MADMAGGDARLARREQRLMCDRCGEPGIGAHAVAMSERPAQRLSGRRWEGNYAQARAGALRAVMDEVRAFSDRQPGLFRSPIVALTWNGEGERFRHFVGIATDETPSGFDRLDLPGMLFATSWHGPEDGDVAAHYGAIMGRLREDGLGHDRTIFDHREEYPPDADPDGPPALRLMVPVLRD